MMRYVIAAILIVQVTLNAQDGARAIPNPFSNDPFWSFHAGSEQYARLLAKAQAKSDPVAAIEGNLGTGSKLGAVRAARGLLTVPAPEFTRGVRLLIERSHDLNDDGTTLRAEFVAFVADASKRVDSFGGDEGAEAASAMLTLESLADPGNEAANTERIKAFLARYAGTPAALRMEVSRVDASRLSKDRDEWLRRYRELAQKYDRTVTGAMALYYVGSRQANCCHAGTDAPQFERLLEVFDIVKQLESGRFPDCEWVNLAAPMISNFFFFGDEQPPAGTFSKFYGLYLEFMLAHPTLRSQFAGDPHAWILRNQIPRLVAKSERLATVERFLGDLQKGGYDANRVRFLRASFYFDVASDDRGVDDPLDSLMPAKTAEATAIRELRAIVASGDAPAAARAIGILGEHYFGSGQYAEARAQFSALLAQYPGAEWSWDAALRVAQINERLGVKTAIADYEAVASRKNLPPAAVLLSRLSAAELRERSGDLQAAAAHYREALAAWTSPYPLHIFWHVVDEDLEAPVFRRFADLKKSDVETRLDRLSKAESTDEALLYEGRRAIETDRPGDAIAPLRKLIDGYPKSAAAIEGRRLLRRAQFSDLLARPQDRTQVERSLDELGRGPYDFVTTLAQLAKGAIRVRTNDRAGAETITRQALEEWHVKQSTAIETRSPLTQDIVAIRSELFRPQGGGIFGNRGGNAFEWPTAMPPFAIVSRDVQVVTADGKEQRVSAPFNAKVGTRVLFATYEDLASMRAILDRIGGTETAEWVRVMDVPNQPIGGSVEIAELWSKYFPMRPGHWGGWELTIYPYVSKITFDRDAHALAYYTVGYSGGTIELAKENGAWIAKRIVSVWIE